MKRWLYCVWFLFWLKICTKNTNCQRCTTCAHYTIWLSTEESGLCFTHTHISINVNISKEKNCFETLTASLVYVACHHTPRLITWQYVLSTTHLTKIKFQQTFPCNLFESFLLFEKTRLYFQRLVESLPLRRKVFKKDSSQNNENSSKCNL